MEPEEIEEIIKEVQPTAESFLEEITGDPSLLEDEFPMFVEL